jgi:ribose-phosphate pyrophosphokinase
MSQAHEYLRGKDCMIYVNGAPLKVTLFPDNTSQVWNVPQLDIPDTNWVHIVWEFQHEGEFMHLAQLKALLDAKNFRSALRIKCLPYARQDKAITNETTFALTPFAYLLNTLQFEEIIINDPHSEIAIKMIYNSRAVYPIYEVEKVMETTESTVMCFPDKGAVTKYSKLYARPYTWGEKVRDQSTGKILKYELANPSSIHEENVLIVDDICDGGATFILLAKELLTYGAENVNLFVTHGIFSRGLQPIFDAGIKRIFTQDGEASEVQGHIAYAKL